MVEGVFGGKGWRSRKPVREISAIYKQTVHPQRFIIIIGIMIIMTFPTTLAVKVDYDNCGLFRNYNTDNSLDSSIRTDYSDDHIIKHFYISQYEFDHCEDAHLWIYAKCWGEKYVSESNTHKILVTKTPGGTSVARWFRCYKLFSYDQWQWQMFIIPKYSMGPDQWITVEIFDIDSYNYNNLEFGIDKSYGSCPEFPMNGYLIDDWDQSFWYSGGAGVTPQQENEITGELMIKLELAHRQVEKRIIPMDFDYAYYGYDPYQYVLLDDQADYIHWKCDGVTAGDIGNSMYARLMIYGFSYIGGDDPNPPQTQNFFSIKINNNGPYYYDPDIYWVQKQLGQTQPAGQWYYFDFPASLLAATPGTNVFEIHEYSADYKRHNLGVVLFPDIAGDQSAWYYWNGIQGFGDQQLRYDHCTGELGIYLYVYQKLESSAPKTIGGIGMWCEDHPNHCPWTNNHDRLIDMHRMIVNNLVNNHGWQDNEFTLDDTSEGILEEGYAYMEDSLGGKLKGDRCDLVILSGHGLALGGMQLPLGDFQNKDYTTHEGKYDEFDIYWTEDGYINSRVWKPETDNWKYLTDSATEYSEDGLNLNTDWILSFNCYNLRGLAAEDIGIMEENNPFQLVLYHGVHAFMGFATRYYTFNPQERQNFANSLVNYWTSGYTVIDSFITAVDETLQYWKGQEPINRWMVYYHDSNFNDLLWDEGDTAWDFDFENGYEDRNIGCIEYGDV